jgi:hypothetical protein
VVPRAGLDDMEEGKFLTLLRFELWPLGHPARGQLLYQLHCPRSQVTITISLIHTLYSSLWHSLSLLHLH